jgi:hypothetical protein
MTTVTQAVEISSRIPEYPRMAIDAGEINHTPFRLDDQSISINKEPGNMWRQTLYLPLCVFRADIPHSWPIIRP